MAQKCMDMVMLTRESRFRGGDGRSNNPCSTVTMKTAEYLLIHLKSDLFTGPRALAAVIVIASIIPICWEGRLRTFHR
jgi:hypothetical protein